MVIQKALKEPDCDMRQLAESEGLRFGLVRAGVNGRRIPTPKNIKGLADGLRNQAKRLADLAPELDGVAEGET